MTTHLCLAPHRDNPPHALGGLLLCAGHHASLLEALTGPSAADDPTMDAVWGVRTWLGIGGYASRTDALRVLEEARYRYAAGIGPAWRNGPPALFVSDGTEWHDPRDYRPGGLVRDWTALAGLTGHKTVAASYVSGSSEPRLPINPAVATLRDRIPGVLASWTRVHLEELPPCTLPSGDSPGVLCAWLARSVDWAAAQPWAGEYAAELGQLRARARKLIDLPGRPRAIVGPCVEYVEGRRCDGTLTSAIREEYDARPSLIECDTCGAAWDSTQWMRLGQRVAAMGRRAAA